MANPFVHVELATIDLDKAKSFYTSLFSWQLEDMDMGGGMSYTMINVGEGTGGGMIKASRSGRSILLAGLCAGRRCRSRHCQGKITRCHRHARRHRGAERGLLLDHH
jgi:catechol 2,3-dioxygenase-like lactoylglutathione lyase family enzyme